MINMGMQERACAIFILGCWAAGAQAGRTLKPEVVASSPCNPKGQDLACRDSKGEAVKGLKVSLTFDDGPLVDSVHGDGKHHNNTLDVMNALTAQKVTGTFFVLGERFFDDHSLPGYPSHANPQHVEMLKVMKERGFRIGSHTYHHIQHRESKYTEATIKENLSLSLREPLASYLDPPPVVRLPYGQCWFPEAKQPYIDRCRRVMRQISDQAQIHVGWSIDSEDWKRPQQQPGALHPVIDTVTREACNTRGGVILFHDIQNPTAENISCYITELKKAGYTIVGLEDPSLRSPPANKFKYLDPGYHPDLLDKLTKLPQPAQNGPATKQQKERH